ncbi:MAG: elongation factor G [Chloroflexi bacterium]|nr:MAG: elongation factor G [Chloroflexota bacterium]HDN80194.1 elongation factor G [Chloroflexota bacterium]
MKNDYRPEQIRNVALIAHGSAGKTSLSEAMLYDSGAIKRLGKVEEGNTVSDYDPEELRRKMSVNTSVLPCEWNGHKLNVLDTPGYMDFVGEVLGALRVCEGAIVVVDAASGVEVGTEMVWSYADERNLPRLVFINKMDRENADFLRVVNEIAEKFEVTVIPIQLPVGSQSSFTGVVDLLRMKAFIGPEAKEEDVPAELAELAEEYRIKMVEAAAESDDELIMKYLEGEELTEEEIKGGLAFGVKNRKFVLALCGAATMDIGARQLLDAIIDFLPSPAEAEVKAKNPATGEEEVLEVHEGAPLATLVFKTFADPYVGKLTYLRVYSGVMASDSRVFNPRSREEERIGQLFFLRGKEQIPTKQINPGDIGAVAKLGATVTGDTLCDKGHPLVLPGIKYPEPLFSVAVKPKTKADLDKMSNVLARLVEEDPTLQVRRELSTGETILSGMGESHVDIAVRKLQQKFGVSVETSLPKVPYRETITKVAKAQGKYKKQTGGRGQYGDVWLRLEPLPRGSGFEFAEEIFGGAVPKQYIPAVEKGLKEAIQSGVLAGFPVVDIRAVLYDGSYHPVDSSEIAFKIATHLGFKKAMEQAGPVLLEPIMNVTITVPEQFMGDVLGDLNTKRARVLGMDQKKGTAIIKAQVPLAEMQRYATELRSLTQGRGVFTMEFSHYEEVPAHLAQAIIEKARKEKEAQEKK